MPEKPPAPKAIPGINIETTKDFSKLISADLLKNRTLQTRAKLEEVKIKTCLDNITLAINTQAYSGNLKCSYSLRNENTDFINKVYNALQTTLVVLGYKINLVEKVTPEGYTPQPVYIEISWDL